MGRSAWEGSLFGRGGVGVWTRTWRVCLAACVWADLGRQPPAVALARGRGGSAERSGRRAPAARKLPAPCPACLHAHSPPHKHTNPAPRSKTARPGRRGTISSSSRPPAAGKRRAWGGWLGLGRPRAASLARSRLGRGPHPPNDAAPCQNPARPPFPTSCLNRPPPSQPRVSTAPPPSQPRVSTAAAGGALWLRQNGERPAVQGGRRVLFRGLFERPRGGGAHSGGDGLRGNNLLPRGRGLGSARLLLPKSPPKPSLPHPQPSPSTPYVTRPNMPPCTHSTHPTMFGCATARPPKLPTPQLSKHGYFGTSKRPPVVMEALEPPVSFGLRERPFFPRPLSKTTHPLPSPLAPWLSPPPASRAVGWCQSVRTAWAGAARPVRPPPAPQSENAKPSQTHPIQKQTRQPSPSPSATPGRCCSCGRSASATPAPPPRR